MIRYICDLCGKELEWGKLRSLFMGNSASSSIVCELCPDCWDVILEQTKNFVYNTIWGGLNERSASTLPKS